jgi:imidazolonepropionase-like amidohydrolase
MATLGNMEILKLDNQLGSISEGNWADLLIIKENPFVNIMSMTAPLKVFKDGSCCIDNEAERNERVAISKEEQNDSR